MASLVRGAMLAMAMTVATTGAPGQAAYAAEAGFAASQNYSIAPGPLSPALSRFAGSAGITLSSDPALTENLRTNGLSGSHSIQDGFARLLDGSGLEAVSKGEGIYVLRRLPPDRAQAASAAGTATLPEVTVNAGAIRSATDGSGAYSAGPSATATGLDLSLRETPQSVTVITRQQMDDKNSTTVSDVAKQTTGIIVQNYDSDRWSFSARGFAVTNFQYDGVSALYDGAFDWGATNTDMFLYDRVEVVKGATGLLSGAGDPAATINMVRKRPTRSFAGSMAAGAGSWDNYRTEADFSGPLNASGTLRGRVVGVYQDKHAYIDRYQQQKVVGYGILEADLTPGTLLTVGMDYQDYKPRGSSWTGFPTLFSDGSRTNFPVSWNPATNWSRREMNNRTLFASLEHTLANDWRLKLSVDSRHSRHNTVLGSASGGNPDPVTGAGASFFMGQWVGDQTQTTINLTASGPFTLFGREHELMLGYMTSRAKQDGPLYDALYPPLPGSYFDWRGNYAQPDVKRIGDYDGGTHQSGAYAAVRLRPGNPLSIILGARVSNFEQFENRNLSAAEATHTRTKENGVVTPYAGVVYDLNRTYSVYASYTSIFSPQSYRDINRNFLSPITGKATEAGVKGEFLGGRVNASLAAFQIRQDNVAEYVMDINGDAAYQPVRGATSRGIEMEVAGQISENWNLYAGYTYTHTRDAKGEPVFSGMLQTTQPEHLLRAQATWRLPGAWHRLSVGGGVSWQSAFYGNVSNPALNANSRLTQKAYALFDLMARYQISKQISLSLNINNVFNKKYYTGLGLFGTGFYGEPRNAMATLRYRF